MPKALTLAPSPELNGVHASSRLPCLLPHLSHTARHPYIHIYLGCSMCYRFLRATIHLTSWQAWIVIILPLFPGRLRASSYQAFTPHTCFSAQTQSTMSVDKRFSVQATARFTVLEAPGGTYIECLPFPSFSSPPPLPPVLCAHSFSSCGRKCCKPHVEVMHGLVRVGTPFP